MFPFFMKKKVKKIVEWFYQETDRGETNIAECKSLYDLVEKLQYRLEDMENEHMQLLREMGRIQSTLHMLETDLSDEN